MAEGGLSVRTRGSSVADVHTFWCKKLGIFRNLWYVRTDGGINFLRFCGDVFSGPDLVYPNRCSKNGGKTLIALFSMTESRIEPTTAFLVQIPS